MTIKERVICNFFHLKPQRFSKPVVNKRIPAKSTFITKISTIYTGAVTKSSRAKFYVQGAIYLGMLFGTVDGVGFVFTIA